ncbi:helix-turn-helix protein [Fusobacterium naviforme]|nr:helix-turn-helix protein [Fusobacterium naviforme]STO27732.1 DNA-binding transcriptional repressor PuuR [Fusobacterium naviforme]
MTLGEMMLKYREEHGISQRQFAADSGLSHGYVSMLEKNKHPKTGLPITPTIDIYKKVADGMHMDLHQLFSIMEDQPVVLDAEDKMSTLKKEGGLKGVLADTILQLDDAEAEETLQYIQFLLSKKSKKS